MKVRGLSLVGTWTAEEVAELESALSAIPAAWVEKNDHLHNLVRSEVLRDATPDAPGHSMYDSKSSSIVLFDRGVYHGDQLDKKQFRRSLYHELAHTLLEDESLLTRWCSDTKGDGFVDEYAKTDPREDFADSFSEFFINHRAMKQVAPIKVAFIADLIESAGQQREKIAMSLVDIYEQISAHDTEYLEKAATEKVAAEERDAAGRIMARGFADELQKIANPQAQSLLSKLRGKGPAITKALAIGGTVGGGAYMVGKKKGESEGVMEGMDGLDEGMKHAYQLGVERGAQAMQEAIMAKAQSAAGGGS